MTEIGVVSSSLVSPLGRTAEEHVFLLRAEAMPPASGAFVDADDGFLPVLSCPWIGADRPLSSRLRVLGLQATGIALANLHADVRPSTVLLVRSAGRPGLCDDDVLGLVSTVRSILPRAALESFTGDAGTMEAIVRAQALVREEADVLLLAVDSFVSPVTIDEWAARRIDPWQANLGPIAEAAVALVLTSPGRARSRRVPLEGRVPYAAIAAGSACDENDADEDGSALASLIASIPRSVPPLGLAVGPAGVDPLRRREWELASARQHARFEIEAEVVCAESSLGRLGAASGAASLALALGMRRHAAYRADRAPPRGDFALAWATSPDGRRGVAIVKADP